MDEKQFWQQPSFGIFGWNWKEIGKRLVDVSRFEFGGAHSPGINVAGLDRNVLYIAVRDLNPVAFNAGTPFGDYLREVADSGGDVQLFTSLDTGGVAPELRGIPNVDVRVLGNNQGLVKNYLVDTEVVLSPKTYAHYRRDLDETVFPSAFLGGLTGMGDDFVYGRVHLRDKAVLEHISAGGRITREFLKKHSFGGGKAKIWDLL